jgi:hypothetical protein
MHGKKWVVQDIYITRFVHGMKWVMGAAGKGNPSGGAFD